jgi:hypothetical protein
MKMMVAFTLTFATSLEQVLSIDDTETHRAIEKGG